jgi:hypothetical protein
MGVVSDVVEIMIGSADEEMSAVRIGSDGRILRGIVLTKDNLSFIKRDSNHRRLPSPKAPVMRLWSGQHGIADSASWPNGKAASLHSLQQLPRFTQQRLDPPTLGDRIPAEHPMLARILIRPWRAGPRCAPVHAAALFAAHRRRVARATGAGSGATARARQHRAGVSDVIAHACASRLASAESRRHLGACDHGSADLEIFQGTFGISNHGFNGIDSIND